MECSLCSSCLGRQFGNILSGTTNRQRGESLFLSLGIELNLSVLTQKMNLEEIKFLLKVNYAPIQSIREKFPDLNESINFSSCFICQELFSENNLAKMTNKLLTHAKNYEFKTFLIGCKLSPSMIEREEELRAKYELQFGESIKSEYNRELGKRFANDLVEKIVDFQNPDILFVVNTMQNNIEVNPNPLFIEGRYRKLVRNIPQAIWNCKECRGKGCKTCNYSGRNYPDAVEEYITPYFLRATKGSETKFHCSGREDVDALMLGKGRPFVIEIRKPKIRSLNLAEIEEKINKKAQGRVDCVITQISSRTTVRNIKSQSRRMGKRYRMKIGLEKPNDIDLNIICKNLITKIEQQTPMRVLHRRSDLVRFRHVFDFKITKLTPLSWEVEVYCEGGLYVKELMHGDDGRTKPSLASILQTKISVYYLDVLEIEEIPL